MDSCGSWMLLLLMVPPLNGTTSSASPTHRLNTADKTGYASFFALGESQAHNAGTFRDSHLRRLNFRLNAFDSTLGDTSREFPHTNPHIYRLAPREDCARLLASTGPRNIRPEAW